MKVTKVYNVLLDKRGGDLDPNSRIYLLLYRFLLKFEAIILKILVSLKNKELYAHVSKAFPKQVFYGQLRKTLQLLFELYNIQINYKLSNGLGPKLLATAIFTRGATGIISAWFPVLRSVLGPLVLFFSFILKDEKIEQHLKRLF